MDATLRIAERSKDSDQIIINLKRAGLSISAYIDEKLNHIANLIESKFRLEKELWQQVPYWCWAANGRTGWNEKLEIAYRKGVYRVTNNVLVDCETGRLVYRWRNSQLDSELNLEDLIPVILELINNDVYSILESLKEAAGKPRASYMMDAPSYDCHSSLEPPKIYKRSCDRTGKA